MRTGRPKATLTVTDDERRQLQSLAHRSRTASFLARRARIILACADGLTNTAVARRLRVAPGTVGKWRHRFVEAAGRWAARRAPAGHPAPHHRRAGRSGDRAARWKPRRAGPRTGARAAWPRRSG